MQATPPVRSARQKLPTIHSPRIGKVPATAPTPLRTYVTAQDHSFTEELAELQSAAAQATPKGSTIEEKINGCLPVEVLRAALRKIFSDPAHGPPFSVLLKEYNNVLDEVTAGTLVVPTSLRHVSQVAANEGVSLTELKELRVEMQTMEKDIRQLRQERDDYLHQIGTLRQANDTQYKHITRLEEQLSELEAQIRRMTQQLREKDTSIVQLKLRHSIAASRVQNILARQQQTDGRAELNSVLNQIIAEGGREPRDTDPQSVAEEAQARERELRDTLRSLNEERVQLLSVSEAATRKSNDLELQVNLIIAQHEAAEQELHAQIATLTKTVQELEDKAKTHGATETRGRGKADAAPKSRKVFVGLGTGKHIPVYLQYHGKVRNRNIPKRELELLVQDIWATWKERAAPTTGNRMSMAEFFRLYLQQKFGIPSVMAEWAYSIVDRLEKYNFDADVALFTKVLTGALPAEIHDDQLKMMAKLRAALQEVDTKRAAKLGLQGTVSGSEAAAVLRKLFPYKSEEHLGKLQALLGGESAVVDYSRLFESDAQGNQSAFTEELRSQHLEEAEEYQIDVEEALRGVDSSDEPSYRLGLSGKRGSVMLHTSLLDKSLYSKQGGNSAAQPDVHKSTLRNLRSAWLDVDPGAEAQITRTFAIALKISPERVDWDQVVDVDHLVSAIFGKVLLKRCAKRPDGVLDPLLRNEASESDEEEPASPIVAFN